MDGEVPEAKLRNLSCLSFFFQCFYFFYDLLLSGFRAESFVVPKD
jgi:hypothetical protein